jgi:hypothetical protein
MVMLRTKKTQERGCEINVREANPTEIQTNHQTSIYHFGLLSNLLSSASYKTNIKMGASHLGSAALSNEYVYGMGIMLV